MTNFNFLIYKNIQKILKDKNINQKELSETIGTSEQNLSKKLKKLKEGTGITTTSLFEISKALKTNINTLFKDCK